jgi:hypothetical protein
MRSKTHSKLSPSIEVVSSSDSSTATLVPTDRPVLVEGARISNDRRLVDLSVLIDIIDGSIAGDSSLEGHAAAWVVFTIVFHDVVFNEGALSPAVDSEVSISGWVEISGKVDVSNTT